MHTCTLTHSHTHITVYGKPKNMSLPIKWEMGALRPLRIYQQNTFFIDISFFQPYELMMVAAFRFVFANAQRNRLK